MTTINLNQVDELASLEGRIRNDGVWCRPVGKFGLSHKMICKRVKSSIAISRCGQIILPFEKLTEDNTEKKCLVCALYDTGSEEVKLASEKTLARLIDTIEIKSQTD